MAPLLRQGLVLLLLCVGVSVVLDGSVVTQRQTTNVVIEGSVTDVPGGTIPGAVISILKDKKTVATKVTDAYGKFRFERIEPGKYVLSAALAGFQTYTQPLTVTDAVPLIKLPPIRLPIGVLTETLGTLSSPSM